MDGWSSDLRHAWRALRTARGFTAVAVLSLAIGIGANTAIFSVTNALLLRPLPYRGAERLAILWQRSPGLDVPQDWFSVGQYLDIASENTVFARAAAAIGASYNLTSELRPERVDGVKVTSSFFPLFGAEPALGRVFSADDDQPGRAPAVVLANGFWRRRFGGDPSVIGRVLLLNGSPVTIVGVLSPDFTFDKQVMPAVNGIERADLFLPLPLPASARETRDREDYNVFAALRPGVTRERAQAEMDVIARRMQARYPASYPPHGGLTISVVPLLDQVVGDVRLALRVLLGAVGFLLLIACANVANLQLSRGAAREKELAIRAAVGAARGRLVRQLLTESVLLSLLGAIAGLLLALGALAGLRRFGPANVPRLGEIEMDARVLAFTAMVALASGVLFGLVPALRASHVEPNAALREGGRGTAGSNAFGLGHGRLRRALVVSEVALALVLLIGAGLLGRSYARITSANPGFDPRGVLSFRVSLPGSRYSTPEAVALFYRRLEERLAALPGVTHVGANYQLPLSSVALAWEPVGIEGYVPKAAGRDLIISSSAYVSPDYFRAMGIPLLSGRFFTAQDTRESPEVVIVDDKLAARFWPGQSALGKRLRQGADGPWRTVVGVVADTRQYAVDAEPPITAFFPVAQYSILSRFIVVRTAVGGPAPAALVDAATRELHALDPDLPIYDVHTMEQRLHDSLARRRLAMSLLGTFALFALVLASVGIYGVIAYWVGQRRREIGIRMALGADRAAIVGLVARESLAMVAVGLAAGLLAALALTRLMERMLFGVAATDATTFALFPLVLAAVAVGATWLPARRATRVEPMTAVRAE